MAHSPRQPALACRYAILQPPEVGVKIAAELQGH